MTRATALQPVLATGMCEAPGRGYVRAVVPRNGETKSLLKAEKYLSVQFVPHSEHVASSVHKPYCVVAQRRACSSHSVGRSTELLFVTAQQPSWAKASLS